MTWLTDPFSAEFLQRAFVGGALAALVCALVGTWVVVRGLAFLGEAMAHGMLPGVAVATLLGWPTIAGAAASTAVMSVGIGWLSRRTRVSSDTAIGLLFAGMLALGVAIVSRSRSFATDVTAILFGDVLAIRAADITTLAIGLGVIGVACLLLHRPFLALSFDARVATTLGMRPAVARVALTALVTAAVVASYQAVGSLLVVALLLAPAVAARQWTRRIPTTMLLAAAVGVLSVTVGLLVSWHAGIAGGASIAVVAVAAVAVSVALRTAVVAVRAPRTAPRSRPLLEA